MDQVLDILHRAPHFGVNPYAGVVVAALLAALIEQRMARRRTPDFSSPYHEIFGRQGK
jgi:hypothetical protein